jgi:hypothetical protein
MRRTLWLLLILAIMAGCINCKGGPNPTKPTVTAPSVRPKPIPTATPKAIGEALNSPTLGGLRLIRTGVVRLSGVGPTLTVATQRGVKQFVPIPKLQSAANLLQTLPGRHFKTTVKSGRVTSTAAYGVDLRQMSKRYLLFVTGRTAAKVADESLGTDPGLGGMTLYRGLGSRGYDVSLVFARYTPNNYDLPGRPRLDAPTYVELCQNVLQISPVGLTSRLPLSSLSTEDLGQEVWCNSYGMAMAIARGGFAYSAYLNAATGRILQLSGNLGSDTVSYDLTWVVFSASEYKRMR